MFLTSVLDGLFRRRGGSATVQNVHFDSTSESDLIFSLELSSTWLPAPFTNTTRHLFIVYTNDKISFTLFTCFGPEIVCR